MLKQFTEIDHWLLEHQAYWRIEPFLQACFPKQRLPSIPAHIQEWLNTLQPEEILRYKLSPEHLYAELRRLLPSIASNILNASEPQFSSPKLELSAHSCTGIPGRKLEQIVAMSSVCLDLNRDMQWLEWCSGKGYLGRILASISGKNVTSLEFQQQLCRDGQHYAEQHHLPMTFVHGDAFSDEAESLCCSDKHAVALHACGDLHVRLIKNAAQSGMAALSVAPCCYHLIQDETYQPLSRAAKQSGMRLSKADLRIPLQETVTGGERVHRHRKLEMTYRLAFQHLITTELGLDDYLPIPSIKKSLLSEGFEAFCHSAADKKQLTLPPVDWAEYEREGEQRFWRMEALSLLPQLFRRPLEQWLVLDRALFLEEHGYSVEVGTFCQREVTPRNLLIRANRASN
ncbi:methyltransferase [Vibrio astriarenae]